MAIIALKTAGKSQLSAYGKKMVAHMMFDKGRNFVAAAVLLDQKNGHKDIVFHLICQGLEIIQKALLMAHDYDKYNQKKLMTIGHDLVKGSNELITTYGFRPLKIGEKKQLQAINNYYKQHLLRYVGIHDLVGGNSELIIEKLFRRTVALSKLGQRIFK